MSYLRLTGNPIIDNGNAVIAMFCNKDKIENVNPKDILDNTDDFFEDIKHCYDYKNAIGNQKKFERMGLKQHLIKIYNNNHCLHGNNNYIDDLVTKKKKKVNNVGDYFKSFKEEVENLIKGENSKLHLREESVNNDNVCYFCGRRSDFVLSKDVFPMLQGISDINLGKIYSCSSCYLAVLFFYFNTINVRFSKNKSGMYMFYHFSDERLMIEVAKQQYKKLKSEMLASLETIIGNKYKIIVEDLRSRFKLFSSKYADIKTINTTVYFLNNHNQNPQLDYINIPDGMCRFLYYMNNAEKKWEILVSRFDDKHGYKDLVEGKIRYSLFNGMVDALKVYLKEVLRMDENLLEAIENISGDLIKYYREKYGDNWVKYYYKKISNTKTNNITKELLEYNEEYFKTYGKNLFNTSDVKLILTSKKYNLFSLVKFFVHNNMNLSETDKLSQIYREKKNIENEEEN